MQGLNPVDYKKHLAGLSIPTLVLIGDQDEAFISSAFESLLNQDNPKATFKLLSAVTHLNLVNHIETPAEIMTWFQSLL